MHQICEHLGTFLLVPHKKCHMDMKIYLRTDTENCVGALGMKAKSLLKVSQKVS